MYYLLSSGGFTTGGFNFDAKLRRQSIDPNDLYFAHVYGLDTLARAVLAAADLIEKGRFKSLIDQRYASWQGELGKKITSGALDLAGICDYAVKANLNPNIPSGKQELFESLVANAASNIK